MRAKVFGLTLGLLVGGSVVLVAQNVDHFPASSIAACKVSWTQTVGTNDIDVLATVQAYSYRTIIDSVVVPVMAVCTGPTAPYQCTTGVPTQGQGVGPHSLQVTASDQRGQTSTSAIYNYIVDSAVGAPGVPGGVRITGLETPGTLKIKKEPDALSPKQLKIN